jgi:hypothetical protein
VSAAVLPNSDPELTRSDGATPPLLRKLGADVGALMRAVLVRSAGEP